MSTPARYSIKQISLSLYLMDIKLYDEELDDFKLFCLEGVDDIDHDQPSDLLDFLAHLALNFGITNVYKTCDTMEGFEESIGALVYEDRYFKAYKIIYLVMKGSDSLIEINGYLYSLEEVALLFEGKLKGKIIHFANTKMLDLEEETFQFFLDITGAKAISGYVKDSNVLSTVLDQHFFALYQEEDDVVELVETLFEKHAALCQRMGFRLYY